MLVTFLVFEALKHCCMCVNLDWCKGNSGIETHINASCVGGEKCYAAVIIDSCSPVGVHLWHVAYLTITNFGSQQANIFNMNLFFFPMEGFTFLRLLTCTSFNPNHNFKRKFICQQVTGHKDEIRSKIMNM